MSNAVDKMTYIERIEGYFQMTADELKILRAIYFIRLRIFGISYFFITLMATYAAISAASRMSKYSKLNNQHTHVESYWFLFDLFMYIALIAIAISGVWIYLKKIRPYAIDLKLQIKEKITYKIILKRSFITETYFLGLNHPDYLFHQVSLAEYQTFNVGDDLHLYRTKKSKYIFNPFGNYEVM